MRKVDIILICTFCFLVGILWYRVIHSRVDSAWFTDNSPDGRFSVEADYESPYLFPPPTSAQILLYDKEKQSYIGAYHISVNMIEPLGKDCYNVEWHEEYVKIETKDNDGKRNVVRIYWENSNLREVD